MDLLNWISKANFSDLGLGLWSKDGLYHDITDALIGRKGKDAWLDRFGNRLLFFHYYCQCKMCTVLNLTEYKIKQK